MRIALVLLGLTVLLAFASAARAEPFVQGQVLNQRLVADVTAAAMDFMAPRTLEAVPMSQLTAWGLRGITTIDPQFTIQVATGMLLLIGPDDRVVQTMPIPAADDAAGWGLVTARMIRAAWDASEPVRLMGTGGMIRTFFEEMFNHLDPYSRYVAPEDADRDRTQRNGRATIGLALTRRGSAWVVRDVAADGPAAAAGVRPGEALLAVDGQSLPVDARGAEALLAGPENSQVTLALRGRRGVHAIELTRVPLPPETVTRTRAGEMLVVRISGFSATTGRRLAGELMRGVNGPHRPRGVVLDMRGNRGGPLIEAVAAARTLLTSGLIAVTAGRDASAAHEFRAEDEDTPGRDLADGLPVVVIVDGRTASAAEILAAALADQRRAVVVGSATLGKGLVQTIAQLPDGGELFVTWSRVLAPFGWPIQGLGVMPQICTSLGEEALNRQLTGLKAGQQELAPALHRSRDSRAPIPAAEVAEIRNACPASEARESDLLAARVLINTPAAYTAALIGPP